MKPSIAVLAPSLVALALPVSAQQPLRSLDGTAAGAQFGSACTFADLLVDALGFDSSRGAIYCGSSAYLASGARARRLWLLVPPTTTNLSNRLRFVIAP